MNRIVEEQDFFIEEQEDEKDNRAGATSDPTDDVSSDDDDSSVDEDAHLKQICPSKSNNNKGFIRRNESFQNFLTRSERNILLGKDKPPSPEEAQKRSVKFKEDNLEQVNEVHQIDDEDKANYWLTHTDFDRMEADLKITTFRWENHKAGKIQFDEDNNSIRGLEQNLNPNPHRPSKTTHRRQVFEEINEQKRNNDGRVFDWEKVRQASQEASLKHLEIAIQAAKDDEEARIRSWDPSYKGNSNNNNSQSDSSKDKKKKKKGGGGLFFWQKKK